MCKLCWASVVALLLVVSGMTYNFIVKGEVAEIADGRTEIKLNKQDYRKTAF